MFTLFSLTSTKKQTKNDGYHQRMMKQAQVHGASIASSQINGKIILSDGQRCTYIGSMPKINLLARKAPQNK